MQSGVVRCFSLSKDGDEHTINIFKPISFFPVGWVINDASDNYTYEAVTDVEVFIAPKDDFEKFLQENHDVVYNLLKRIYRGLEGYLMRMESLLSGNPYFRTVVQLVIHTRRFGVKKWREIHCSFNPFSTCITYRIIERNGNQRNQKTGREKTS